MRSNLLKLLALVSSLTMGAIAQADPIPVTPAPSLLPGFIIEWVQVSGPPGAPAPGAPHSIANAIDALNGTGGFTVLDRVTQVNSFVNFVDANVPFAGVDPVFAIRVSGYIDLAAGTYSFLAIHDDGIRVRVGGETVITFDADTPPVETDSAFFTLPAGVYEYEAIGWEQGGQFALQLGIDINGTEPDGRFFLAGAHVPEPASLALLGLGLAGLGFSRRKTA